MCIFDQLYFGLNGKPEIQMLNGFYSTSLLPLKLLNQDVFLTPHIFSPSYSVLSGWTIANSINLAAMGFGMPECLYVTTTFISSQGISFISSEPCQPPPVQVHSFFESLDILNQKQNIHFFEETFEMLLQIQMIYETRLAFLKDLKNSVLNRWIF